MSKMSGSIDSLERGAESSASASQGKGGRAGKYKVYCKRLNELKNAIGKLDMLWPDAKEADILRRERVNMEQCRQAFEGARSEYFALLSEEQEEHLEDKNSFIMEQVILLRSKVGEIIYNLEREEAGSRRSSKSDARESMNSYESRRLVRLKTTQSRTEDGQQFVSAGPLLG